MSFLKSNISKTVHLGTKFLYNTNRKPYPIYPMVALSCVTSDPDFKVTIFFEAKYRKNGAC